METTIYYGVYTSGIMEKKMETTTMGYIGFQTYIAFVYGSCLDDTLHSKP